MKYLHFILFVLLAAPVFGADKIASHPLPLAPIFNRALADEQSNDGKGGWTDQGPEMDLRSFRPGKQLFSGIQFETVPSCLVLGESSPIKEAGIDLANLPEGMNHLYLLHASAWTPAPPARIGVIRVRYADGSNEAIPVVSGRDCGNWYKPVAGANALPAWLGELSSAPIGIYLSYFPLKGKPERLEFRRENGCWLILGASLADRKVRIRQAEEPFIVKDGPTWLPIRFTGVTAAGSPLDLTALREAPAGKYGRIIADAEGRLVFEKAPDKRIRLFGPNLVQSANFLTPELADAFIRQAESLGYNTVRLHHIEQGLLDPKAPDSLTINPKALDNFHYLCAKLKERGFYLTIDLYASRRLKAGDKIPEFDDTGEFSMKNLVPISPEAMENWKSFSRQVLSARNPYTGLSLAEDPALAFLNLVNENPLISQWNGVRAGRAAALIYKQKFEEYLKTKGFTGDTAEVKRNGLFIEFLNDLQGKCIAEQSRFLREELGLKALITDLNMCHQFTLAELRSGLDLVDIHQYWDHPSFPEKRWGYPFVFHNRSSIAGGAVAPGRLMSSRVFGKPFVVTEFNFCFPNSWRVEAPTLTGGYAALQDWDGLYRFAWSHSAAGMKNPERPMTQFDIVNNLQAQMTERIIYFLFVRGDVKSAEKGIAFDYRPELVRSLGGNSMTGTYPDSFRLYGLYERIGTLANGAVSPGVVKVNPLQSGWEAALSRPVREAMENYRKTGVITSQTREITLAKKSPSLHIVAPRSDVYTGSLDVAGKVLKAEKLSVYQTLALHSLDGKELAGSEKLLLIQLTDLSNDGLRFDDKKRRVLRSWGKLPQMLERGSAEITLAVPRKLRVIPLELDGTPAAEIPAEYRDGKLRFRLATDRLPGGTLSCLLIP